MAYIEWAEVFEVGIGVIDYQHKRLVQIICDLHDVNQEVDLKEPLLEVILDELARYTQYHFETEENLMSKVEFLDFKDHKIQHDFFVRQLFKYRDQYKEGKEGVGDALLVFLKKWLLNHIQKEDKEILAHLTSGGGVV